MALVGGQLIEVPSGAASFDVAGITLPPVGQTVPNVPLSTP
jgi:hypothetical protein